MCACAIAVLASVVFRIESEKRVLKDDLIELSKAKYGLFNVDEWKEIMGVIIAQKIEEFDLDETNRAELHARISGFLGDVIKDFESKYHRGKQRSIEGIVQSFVAGVTGIFGEMKRNVPDFTDQIIDFMNEEENRENIKAFIIEKIDEYAANTFAEVDYTLHDATIARYDYGTREATITGIRQQLDDYTSQQKPYAVALFTVVIFLALFTILARGITRYEFSLLVLSSLILLAMGVLLPMIDIDARVSHMQFQLLGEPVAFYDQVLYFKSKSILEVVELMLTQRKADLFVVGILVLTFSVLFPLSKLTASIGYLYTRRIRNSSLVRFLVFRTAKWSMADVMVITIFMAYIGFSGIIAEQLRQIDQISRTLDILTTNESCLQLGFFLFTAFALLSLLVSHRMQYSFRQLDVG